MTTYRNIHYKMVLLGNYGVGKTCIVDRLLDKPMMDTTSTIGASFHSINHKYSEKNSYRLNIWDTAGQERYRSITEIYFNGVNSGIITYDMNDLDTLLEVEDYWLKSFYENRYMRDNKTSDLVLFIVGNKRDLYLDENKRPKDENLERNRQKILDRIREKYPSTYILEVSAKTNYGIAALKSQLFNCLDQKALMYHQVEEQEHKARLKEHYESSSGYLNSYKPKLSWCNLL